VTDLLFVGSFGFKILIAISQTLFFFSSQKVLGWFCWWNVTSVANLSAMGAKELWTACGYL